MTEVIVTVEWGPRGESPQVLAERWLSLLDRLTAASGGELGQWRWDVDGPAPGPAVPADAKEFAAALEAANPQDDADLIGWTGFVVGRQPDGGYARLRISAGGTDEYTPFTATLNLFAGPGAQAPPLDGRFDAVLAVLADVWDADCGLVYDRELFEAVKSAYGLSAADPRVGWAVHLSANRAARVPEDFPARRLDAGHGGAVLAIGTVTQEVLAAQRILADAGALEALPFPADRPKL
ncbi:hypothetical protein [Streptomyces sp. SYSU K21746]